MIKKTYESIKDAQWQAIKDVVTEWGMDELFTFYKSPLEIICVNGNKFIARGCDKPEKLKSIKDPTDAWYEEMNQLEDDEYTIASTTLRGKDGVKVQEWCSFNPETGGSYADFWLYKRFFAHTNEKSFSNTLQIENGNDKFTIQYTAVHSTYYDNKFCTKERQAKLEMLKEVNPYYYKVYCLGEWGNKLNESPWAYAFSREKHVKRGLQLDRLLPLFTAWDFNRNPICCSIIQHDKPKRTIRVLRTIKIPNSGVDEVCNRIITLFPGCLYIVTGDYSGHNRQSIMKEQITHYTMIQHKLRVAPSQIKTRPNPRLEDNRTLVNLVLQHYNVEIDEENAKDLIFDMENVQSLADGSILKEDRKDPKQQSDTLDNFRYFINLELDGFERMYLHG